ncbi:peptidoglycan DD-metalloendopeptidase family protein [Paraburkholderia phenoliruptrix]|uniref:peptidoglycan DD-metalloendopeptidase family protein n=1 Tax=Paraburkholderia phenoliruptrix TaxID=252970 RepID=UPI001C6E1292|nr:peptidoglycan DD-metalloendopeptidase family protein [Paraburkholderia phenoliruptrix]MBW9104642.1 peptidoglycan DD-metalloendopeptidase family protein [Paraburkholderia phenoliruptrix]MBW9133228.1 peptidoglycan DD-metalloendopeptidase family protein [Paraburkholderia ginsengiterrae]
MKISLSRCAQPLVTMLLVMSLSSPLSACALHSPGAASSEAPASEPLDPIAALANGSALAARGEATVPSGFYRVNPGDTLTAVARDFGRDVSAIARWNHLPADAGLRPGQILRVAPPPANAAGNPAASNARAPAAADTRADKRADAASGTTRETKARLMWPVSGAVQQPFIAGKTKGVTLAALADEQVKAAANGKVVYAGSGIPGYGRLVIVKHDSHLLTAYGNNRALLVKEGTLVKKGQAIADPATDASGDASMRFEVRRDGKAVDPLPYLPTRR